MIVVTGAAGFIASGLVEKLNEEGFYDLVLVDDFSREDRKANYINKKYTALVDRSAFIPWLHENESQVQFVFHLGARTDTTEFNQAIFDELNLNYSKDVWNACVQHGLPLVYASSAATYGDGALGYDDRHDIVDQLKPLNPYGDSKNDFDKWALKQEKQPYFWAGLKFFNVYGPNEFHKGRMASVVFHSFNQISENGKVKLFRSHRPDYTDGGQMRDFVYVKDVAKVCYFLMHHRKDSGLYNLGSGTARPFKALAEATFKALGKEAIIEFIDTPIDIRDKYQYFTEANMNKLLSIGYKDGFHSLEEGVEDYVKQHLIPHRYW
ncbi:MAG: ADP-glyceromanno-heptose 6-epimerase [Flavobacteriales bacterium]|jgi:ADP-L-glycero-D-manno-heptose 6-epimerase|nr:ADP-glyceromanno-heptose 6-epimerase [Flavobacteriales bacterium]MDP4952463.1 ADP-glyceromanno-heptose 6-epimerase [Flavobacteriales bacterium]